MDYMITPYAVAQFVVALISIGLSIILWKRRHARGGQFLFLLFLAISIWTFANSMESAAVSWQTKIFWSTIAYIGAQTSPAFLLLFAVEYTGKKNILSEFKIGMLFIVPIFTILMAATNENHGLIWSGFSPGPAGTNSLIYSHGIFFWMSISYIYFLIFVASYMLFFSTVGSQRVYKRQNRIVAAASIFPWIGSVLYLFDLNPFPGLDLISISFFFTGLAMIWAITREKLMDVVPVSHEFLFENLEDGILVIDENLRIIEINSSAEKILKIDRIKEVGQPVQNCVPFWDQISPYFIITSSKKIELKLENPGVKYMQIHISPLLYSRKRSLGWVVVMENITLRKNAELNLKNAKKLLESRLEENRLLQSKLQEQVIRDALTGTFNRRYLDDMFMRELARADRKGYPISIFMIDADHFKMINDSYGHNAGDQVIAGIGKILVDETRASDCVCRYGGDEFVVISPEMEKEDAIQRAEKLREILKQMHFNFDGKDVVVTISIGIASYPMNGKDANMMIDSADKALYEAKAAGRDCVRTA